MTEILDYSGTVCVIIAALLFASKKANLPKTRKIAFTFFLLSNVFWIPMSLILQAYGLFISQIIMAIINTKGLINLKGETTG